MRGMMVEVVDDPLDEVGETVESCKDRIKMGR